MHLSLRKLVAVVVVATAAACSGGKESPTGPVTPLPSGSDPVAGRFGLSTVNANVLPHTIFNESGYVLAITSSTLALETTGQFILAMTTRETVDGFSSHFVDSTRGTWTQNAGAVTLTSTAGTPATATWDGVKLSFPMEVESRALALVFTRTPTAAVIAQVQP